MDGNVLAVRAVLKAGAKLTPSDNKGRTALMYAVAKGDIATIKEIVNAGADPTAEDRSGKRVEHFALTRANFDKISPILSSARSDWKAAHPTIHDQLSSLSVFPETSFSYLSPVSSPIKSKREGGGEEGGLERGQSSPLLLRDDSFFGSPSRLHTASSLSSAGGGGRKRAPPIFASPFNPKANRSTLELVRIADYVGLDAFLDGCTMVAINEQDKKSGRTALMIAVLQQKMIPVKMLLDAGADMEIKDCQGKTALAHAAATGNLQCIQLLLDTGAEVHTMDGNGRTPVDQAEMGGKKDVFDLLWAAWSPKKKLNRSVSSFEELIETKKYYEKSKHEEKNEIEEKEDTKGDNDDLLRIDCE